MTNAIDNPKSRSATGSTLRRFWWAWIDHLGRLAICEMMAAATFWSEEALHGYLHVWTCISKEDPHEPTFRPVSSPGPGPSLYLSEVQPLCSGGSPGNGAPQPLSELPLEPASGHQHR